MINRWTTGRTQIEAHAALVPDVISTLASEAVELLAGQHCRWPCCWIVPNVLHASTPKGPSCSPCADSLDAIRTFSVACMVAYVAIVTVLINHNSVQAFRAPPSIQKNFALGDPSFLDFIAYFIVHSLLPGELGGADVFFVVVTKMVSAMILAIKWAP